MFSFLRKKSKKEDRCHPRLCSKANERTWLNPYMKLELTERRYVNPGETLELWSVLVWSGNKWEYAGGKDRFVYDAIYFMREISAHAYYSPDGKTYWNINCKHI